MGRRTVRHFCAGHFSAHFRLGLTHVPYFTNDCQYSYATRKKLIRKLRIIRSLKFYANPCGTKNALTV
jgi:hypothetical protein